MSSDGSPRRTGRCFISAFPRRGGGEKGDTHTRDMSVVELIFSDLHAVFTAGINAIYL